MIALLAAVVVAGAAFGSYNCEGCGYEALTGRWVQVQPYTPMIPAPPDWTQPCVPGSVQWPWVCESGAPPTNLVVPTKDGTQLEYCESKSGVTVCEPPKPTPIYPCSSSKSKGAAFCVEGP